MLDKISKLAALFALCLFCAVAIAKIKPVLPIQHWKTDNGVRVLFVRATQLPMVDIQVVFDAGSAQDGKHFGLAQFTNSMLNKGAKGLSADQIAEKFDDVGAVYSASVSRDMALVGLRSLTEPKYFRPALKTFIHVLSAPDFPQVAFQRLKKRIVHSLKTQQQYPQTVARKAFFRTVYANQPYGHPVVGTQVTVKAITRQQAEDFYKHYYVANNALLVIVGDLTRQAAEQVANQVVGALPKGEHAPKLLPAQPLTKAKLLRIPFPAVQTSILIGQVGINYKNPDYFPLMVGNYILGGQPLIARLFMQVREKRGLAYAVSSAFIPMRERGPFVMSMQTRNGKASEALAISNKVLDNFVKNGPTAKEITLAKQSLVGSFPLGIASNSAILSKLVVIGYYHLPLNFLDTYRKKIAAVTRKQIVKAFQKQLRLNKMVTVMVGKFPVHKETGKHANQ